MRGTTYSSLQSSNTLNYRCMITHRASESVYCILLSAVNGLSCLTKLTTSKGAGTADSIRKFPNRPIPFESNRGFEFESNLEASQVPSTWVWSNAVALTVEQRMPPMETADHECRRTRFEQTHLDHSYAVHTHHQCVKSHQNILVIRAPIYKRS